MELAIEGFFPVRAEGFDEDVFDGFGVLVAGIEFPAALGLAEMDPVGGAVAGALEARRFAEGFHFRHALLYRKVPSRRTGPIRSRFAARTIGWKGRRCRSSAYATRECAA